MQAGILLVAVTPFPDVIHAFEHLRVPRTLTTIIAFLYRYLFVLADEALRLLRARDSALGGGSRSKERAQRLLARANHRTHGRAVVLTQLRALRPDFHNAMLARGYTGHMRTLRAHVMRRRDWWTLFLTLLALVLTQWIARMV